MLRASLRVVFLSDAMKGRNGVGTYYEDLVAHLRGRLERVELIAPDKMRPTVESFSVPIPGDATQRLYFPRYKRLPRILREIDPHVVVIPTIGPYSVLGAWHARALGIPVCVGHHTDFERLADMYCNRAMACLSKPALRWICWALLRCGSGVATNNADAAATARRMGISNVRVVHTPIPKSFLDTPVEPLSRELRSVLYLGRLAPEKNIHQVLQAAEELPKVRFVVCGDGPRRRFVERRAAKLPNLEYRGWLLRRQVMSALDEADMLLLPSSVESFGTVALEAFSRRRLALVSPQCGIVDWPSLAENLFYIQPGETLAAAIRRVASLDHAVRDGCAERALVASRSINKAAVDDWMELLADLASTGRLAPYPVRYAS